MQLKLTAALRHPAQSYQGLLKIRTTVITSKLSIYNHLPSSSQKLQARNLTTQGLSTCLTSGCQTAMNLQSQANTGARVMVHSSLHCADHTCTDATSEPFTGCPMQQSSAVATVRVMLSQHHVNTILRTESPSSGRCVANVQFSSPCQARHTFSALSFSAHRIASSGRDPQLHFWHSLK